MRVSQAPVYRRRRRVALAALVAAVGLGAGFGSGALMDAVRGGDEASISTAEAGEASAVLAEAPAAATADPTPAAVPSATASAAEAERAPSPSPSPSAADGGAVPAGFDRDAHSLTDPLSPWVVVNKLNPLEPRDFVPPDLIHPAGLSGGALMREEAAEAMSRMHADAAAAGADFTVSTAYRASDLQERLYRGYVDRSGQRSADTYSARPGYSEHQTGLVADLHNGGACDLRECFAGTAPGGWVAEHAHEYGFIVRYAPGKQDVTGYIYEPWHVRYVGVELAEAMRESGITTMEEFFDLPPAGDYAD